MRVNITVILTTKDPPAICAGLLLIALDASLAAAEAAPGAELPLVNMSGALTAPENRPLPAPMPAPIPPWMLANFMSGRFLS